MREPPPPPPPPPPPLPPDPTPDPPSLPSPTAALASEPVASGAGLGAAPGGASASTGASAGAGPGSGRRRRLIALDTETTGLSASADVVIEVALVEAVEEGATIVEVAHASWLVRPPGPVPPRILELTGIDAAAVAVAAGPAEVWPEVVARLARADLVIAYNAPFDRAFVEAACRATQVALPALPWACALERARCQRPELPGYRLADVATALGLPPFAAHRALDDARAALGVWRALEPSLPASPASTTPVAVAAVGDPGDEKPGAQGPGSKVRDLFR